MGLDLDKDQFTEQDFLRFRQRLDESLVAMEALLERPGFGAGPATVGAELELFLVDDVGAPVPAAEELLRSLDDPRITHELGLFNIEMNLTATSLTGNPFAKFSAEISELTAKLAEAAVQFGSGLVSIGILPTLTRVEHFDGLLSTAKRFVVLERELKRLRGVVQRRELLRIGAQVKLEGGVGRLQRNGAG